jgi:hypothetical protein
VGKGEIARYQQFLLFQQCFENAFFPGVSKGVIVWEWVNPIPYKPCFLHVCSTSLLKTLWEKEKFFTESNICVSHSVFHPFEALSAILIRPKTAARKLFQFGRV